MVRKSNVALRGGDDLSAEWSPFVAPAPARGLAAQPHTVAAA
jgi:hypothetical protein